jgi:hypothetical protein
MVMEDGLPVSHWKAEAEDVLWQDQKRAFKRIDFS